MWNRWQYVFFRIRIQVTFIIPHLKVMSSKLKTIYDHGWNALAVSPDGKHIFVNSGTRTDHGEVQDNGGLFPNARDNALTSKIFRFSITAKDLLLTDDLTKLKADSLLYAEGIR